MYHATTPGKSVLVAAITAGPIFVIANLAAELYRQLPGTIPFRADVFGAFPLVAGLAAVIGFFLAIIPTVLGWSLMNWAGSRWEVARAPIAWTFVGALMGVGICLAFSSDGYAPTQFGIIATSAIAARICRTSVSWDED